MTVESVPPAATRSAEPRLHIQATKPITRPQLWSVQLLRAAAALLVVIGHSQSSAGHIAEASGRSFERLTVLPWGASVDLFFVISGFIMVYASRTQFGQRGARLRFMLGRITRVVPLYWLCTLLMLALFTAAALKGGDPMPTAPGIVASFLFVPADTWGRGTIFPVVDLGWTLNYEAFFYALFALLVGFRRMPAVIGLVAAICALVVLGTWVPVEWPMLFFWTRPILLDFGLGAIVGLICAADVGLPSAARLVMVIGGLLVLCTDPAGIFSAPLGVTVANGFPRVLVAGVPAAVLLAGAVLGPEPAAPKWVRPGLAVGNASYALYLFHPFVIIMMEKAVQKSEFVRDLPLGLLVTGTVIASVLVAHQIYRRVELPLTAAAKARLRP